MQFTKATSALIAFPLIFCISVYAGDSDDWQKAKTANSVEAYSTFLEIHPESKLANGATIALRRARFDFAKQANDPREYEKFLYLYRTGPDAEEIKSLIPDSKSGDWRWVAIIVGFFTVLLLHMLLTRLFPRKRHQIIEHDDTQRKVIFDSRLASYHTDSAHRAHGAVTTTVAMPSSGTLGRMSIAAEPASQGSISCANPQCREVYSLDRITTVSDDDVMNFLRGGGGQVVGKLSGHPVLVDHSSGKSSELDLKGLFSQAPRFGWTCSKCKSDNKWNPTSVDKSRVTDGTADELNLVKSRMRGHSDFEALKDMASGNGLSGDEVIDIIASVVVKNSKL